VRRLIRRQTSPRDWTAARPASLVCLICLAAALTSGCAALFRAEPLEEPQNLLVAPALLGERTVEQRLVIRWPGGERTVEAVLEITPERLQLVLLALGMRVSNLEYDGKTIEETRHIPQAPPGKRMVRDLLLMTTPLAELRQALPEGWGAEDRRQKTEDRKTPVRQREIQENGQTRIMIRYFSDSPWQGRVEFEHRALGYQLILDSHEL
jgi:hypothetical protein